MNEVKVVCECGKKRGETKRYCSVNMLNHIGQITINAYYNTYGKIAL